MPFPFGSDSGDKARRALRDVIQTHLKSAPIKARLPKRHYHVLLPGEAEHAGVIVRVLSESDSEMALEHAIDGRRTLEEYHRFAVVIKADQKSGDSASVSAFVSALKPFFSARYETLDRTLIENAGLHNLMESTDGLENIGDRDDDEGIKAMQTINLRGNTDTWME